MVASVPFAPLSAKEYSKKDSNNNVSSDIKEADGFGKLEIGRWLFVAKITVPSVLHGLCDHFEPKDSREQEVKAAGITTTLKSKMCDLMLHWSEIEHIMIMLIWEGRLIIKNYSEEVFNITL